MDKCVICGKPLDNSDEHIIHNGIGGCLKSSYIYCKTCNSRFGTDQDKDFIQIFAPLLDSINMHYDRKAGGTSYEGVVCDDKGKRYIAIIKKGKIVQLTDTDNNYEKYDKNKHQLLYKKIKFDIDAFKIGVVKIAFNYAIHIGMEADRLEKIFDFSSKTFCDCAIVLPFIPMNSFDSVMESVLPLKLYHTVRIFNIQESLYAYIDLFNTFQCYVLLSEKYDEMIDESFCNIIEKNTLEDDLLDTLTPRSREEIQIISTQYGININDEIQYLKDYRKYDDISQDWQWMMICERIGKLAYEKCRKDTYIKEYEEMVEQQYYGISEIITNHDNRSFFLNFYPHFEFYTIYSDDSVNLNYYKKYLSSGGNYPEVLREYSDDRLWFNTYIYEKISRLLKVISDKKD